ncbi:ester cyclase [Amycolatopsis nigrescens]|uniref:ester cyclase n=1 Tax=Amycolatopsis nigrescens TaxID=381445 RepID=UPI00037A1D5A|nr:ester cyclase [Amycolatopsis nigrescens]
MATDGNTSAATGSGRQGGKELIRHITDKIVNGGDLTLVRELFSEDYVAHKTGLSLPRGPEAFKMAVRQWRDAFPDYRVTIETLFGEGDLIANQFTAEGTHQGSLLGIPPSEKSFKLTGTEVHRVVDGLVVESWLADDLPRILTDVGVLAPGQSNKWT